MTSILVASMNVGGARNWQSIVTSCNDREKFLACSTGSVNCILQGTSNGALVGTPSAPCLHDPCLQGSSTGCTFYKAATVTSMQKENHSRWLWLRGQYVSSSLHVKVTLAKVLNPKLFPVPDLSCYWEVFIHKDTGVQSMWAKLSK